MRVQKISEESRRISGVKCCMTINDTYFDGSERATSQCTKHAAYYLNGLPYCWLHAGREALKYLESLK